MYFYKNVWGRACYQIVRRHFACKTLWGHTRTLPNFNSAFFISEIEGLCTIFLTARLYGDTVPDCSAGGAVSNLGGLCQLFDYQAARGVPPRRWLLFSPPNTDHFQYYYYALITLLHSLRLRPL